MSASVPLRPLGANDPLVPAIGLGLMGFTGVYGQALHSREEQMKFLDAASEMGETFWDTAEYVILPLPILFSSTTTDSDHIAFLLIHLFRSIFITLPAQS